jgi:aminopeptidase-like protein
VGDPGKFTYKKSRQGNAEIDQAVIQILKDSGQDFEINDFSPYGYDERQYCSPGFNLPVGSLTRTPHGRFLEYHTSADNLEFIKPESLQDSFNKYLEVFDILEENKKYLNKNPKCEPQLGKRGLYGALGGRKDASQYEMAILWVLNLSDGEHSILDIAGLSGLSFNVIKEAAKLLIDHGLLAEVTSPLLM